MTLPQYYASVAAGLAFIAIAIGFVDQHHKKPNCDGYSNCAYSEFIKYPDAKEQYVANDKQIRLNEHVAEMIREITKAGGR